MSTLVLIVEADLPLAKVLSKLLEASFDVTTHRLPDEVGIVEAVLGSLRPPIVVFDRASRVQTHAFQFLAQRKIARALWTARWAPDQRAELDRYGAQDVLCFPKPRAKPVLDWVATLVSASSGASEGLHLPDQTLDILNRDRGIE